MNTKFETYCQKAIDILNAKLAHLNAVSPENDGEAESLNRMIVDRTKKLEAVKEAYVTGKASDLAKEVLHAYTEYGENKTYLITDKHRFEYCCSRVKYFPKENWHVDLVSYVLSKTDRLPVVGNEIISIFKDYGMTSFGAKEVNTEFVGNTIKKMEHRLNVLYDIYDVVKHEKSLVFEEYKLLERCQ